jgi:hypothetical protein
MSAEQQSNSSTPASGTDPASRPAKPFEDFLASTPPGVLVDVSIEVMDFPEGSEEYLVIPSISLFCGNANCDRKTFSDSLRKESITAPVPGFARDLFLYFQCRHCRTTRKTYAVRLTRFEKNIFTARKFGEIPNFGPPLPSRLINLFQPDAELLKRGFSAEILGFGVAAIIYYRRVVENQRNRLIDALIEVGKAEGMDAAKIQQLEMAKQSKQFSRSLEELQGAIPDSIKILDQNPIALLHQVFSEAVHQLPDEECLHLASATRDVLIGLTEKLDEVIKQKSEMENTVKFLMKRQSEKGQKSKS